MNTERIKKGKKEYVKPDNEYFRMHKFINKQHPKKRICTFCGIKDGKYEYALKKGSQHSYNVDDYIELCIPCHRKYDVKVKPAFIVERSIRLKANPPDPSGSRMPSLAGLFGAAHPTAKAIIQVDRNTLEPIKEYGSLSEVVRLYGYKYPSISRCLTNKMATAYGFIWRYKN